MNQTKKILVYSGIAMILGFLLSFASCNSEKNDPYMTKSEVSDDNAAKAVNIFITETAYPAEKVRKIIMEISEKTGDTLIFEEVNLYKITLPSSSKLYLNYSGLNDTTLSHPPPFGHAYKIVYEFDQETGPYSEQALQAEYGYVRDIEIIKMKSRH